MEHFDTTAHVPHYKKPATFEEKNFAKSAVFFSDFARV